MILGITQKLVFILVGLAVVFVATTTDAAKPGQLDAQQVPKIECRLAIDPNCSSLTKIADFIIDWMAALAGTLFIAMFLIGGIQYLVSAGDEKLATAARTTLTNGVIGILIVLASWSIVAFVVEGLS